MNIAIIPARSGSKGLKNKNIKMLNGKPMLAYSIIAAKESEMFDVIHVSTDSNEYASIAKDWGADVPFLRIPELASDTSSSRDAIIYALDEYEKRGKIFDNIMVLQPTSPLRTGADISNAFSSMKEKDANAIVSVCEVDHSPLWTNVLGKDMDMTGFLKRDIAVMRRQQLEQYYRLNGAIYLAKVSYYRCEKNIYEKKCFAYIMPKERSVDVDDEFDFMIAEAIMRKK